MKNNQNDRGRRGGFTSLIVEPYKQIKIGLIFLLLNFVFSVVILAIFGYYVYDIYTTVNAYFELSQQEGFDVWQKFQTPILVGSLLLIFFILVTLWVSIKYTHQIYGPMISVNRYLDDIASGNNPAPLKLRERDQLGGMVEKLNKAVAKLKQG